MTEYSTRPHPVFEHPVLDPLPTPEDLEAFYRETYYRLIDEGKRAADIARTRKGGAEADDQARWLEETLHRDVADVLGEARAGGRVLEVGCGLGVLLDNLASKGFAVEGNDLATAAVETIREKGYPAHHGAFDTLVREGAITRGAYDGVLFMNVLEQTFDPVANLRAAYDALRPGGVVIVRSGNDFNPLQQAAERALDLPRWWVSGPEHIHYLSHETVEKMMQSVGLEPVLRQSDFPMELFLLLGFDFIRDRSLGAECHRRRVQLERALPTELRRKLYRAFADVGVGRCLFVAGRKPLEPTP